MGPTDEAEPAADASPPTVVGPPRPPRVLVVDDNPINLELASALLSALGVGPVLASNGAAAVELAMELNPDLVLMDLQMPVLDGVEAARQIRRLERERGRARMPILAFTTAKVDAQRLLDFGFDGLLRKPCEEPALLECLQRWCASLGPLAGRWATGAGRSHHFGAGTEPA